MWIIHQSKMWYFTLSVENEDEQSSEDENNIVKNVYAKKPSQVDYIFTSNMFQPGQIDLDQGIKTGNVATWPGINSKLIPFFLLKSEGTIFGHLEQTRKNTS